MQRARTPSEHERARLLRVTKRRATGLLVAVTVLFVVSTVLRSRAPWLAWIQAMSVGSMVGGLADWFAVTALFRRPLGLPIPHTAIVVERKDRFAETLGAFVQESFLTADAVCERLRAAAAIPRTAAWLASPAHADELAVRVVEALAAGSDLLRDEDVHELLDNAARRQLERISLAPLAGRLLTHLTHQGRHDPLVDSALAGLSRYLDRHGAELHHRLGFSSPWWLPGVVEERVVDRIVARAKEVLVDMGADRSHSLRRQLDTGLLALARDLQTSPSLRRRGEELKAELLAQPQVRDLAAAVWADAKEQLRHQAAGPGSELRSRLAAAIVRIGQSLADDPELAARVGRSADATVRVVLDRFEPELATLVSGTIARWDATETSERLELLLGPDLQYIRVNGTVIGALAGLALHGISLVLG